MLFAEYSANVFFSLTAFIYLLVQSQYNHKYFVPIVCLE